MNEPDSRKNYANQSAVCATQAKNAHVVADIDFLRETVRLARKNGKTQRDIVKDSKIDCSETHFTRWLQGQVDFSEDRLKKLRIYALDKLASFVERVARRHDREFKIDHCTDLMAGLYPHLQESYATHQEQMDRLVAQRIQGYYHVYKYSYRRHGEILKSAAVVTDHRGDPVRPLIYIEKQVNSDNQREDAAGVFFSKSYALWLMAQEVVEEQPRIMLFTVMETGFNDPQATRENHGMGDERIQYLCGFILEAYARWKSHSGAPKGGFMSPIAMQRVPKKQFVSQLGIEPNEIFQEHHIDRVLGHILDDCGYMTRDQFSDDARILNVVRQHMRAHDWADSSTGGR